MKTWIVYSADGKTQRAKVHELEFNAEYMGKCSVTITFESHEPINFQIGDYIQYRDETFYLNVVPACKKQSSRDSIGNAFVYSNVTFNSVADELARCDFLDIVPNDSKVHWTALPTFSFYCENVTDLAERIQANLDRVYGSGTWNVSVENYDKEKDAEISIDKQSVWDALSLVYNTFKCDFTIRKRNIVIGSTGKKLVHTFKYGIGNGLKSLERNVDDSQKVITRLRAYGNTTNMPTNYYKYLSIYLIARLKYPNVEWINYDTKLRELSVVPYSSKPSSETASGTKDWTQNTLSYNNISKNDRDASHWYQLNKDRVFIRYTNQNGVKKEVIGYAAYVDGYNGKEEIRTISWYFYDNDFIDYVNALSSIASGYSSLDVEVYGTENLNFSYLTQSYIDEVNHENYPNNMAITRLMLPNFPSSKGSKDLEYIDKAYKGYSLVYDKNDVYIDSPNISKYGIREGSVYIDGTDNDVTDYDCYPSLEDMSVADLNSANIKIDLPVGDNGLLNYIAADAIAVNNAKLDNGDSDFNKSQVAEMFVWLKDLGFNPWSYRIDETPTISMKSGMCVGRSFDIKNCIEDKLNGHKAYKLTIVRKADDEIGITYPNSDFPIKAGDKFVLLNIRMPDIYYKAASNRLLRYAMKYFVKNDETKFAYTPEIDNLWLARQHDEAVANNKESIYSTIREGDFLLFDENENLGISGNVRISSLKINESKDSIIPLVEIQLEDKKSVGTIQRIQSQISSSISVGVGSGNVGDGISYEQLKTIISNYGYLNFLSKRTDDVSNGQIDFTQGLTAKSSNDGKTTAADGLIEYYE